MPQGLRPTTAVVSWRGLGSALRSPLRVTNQVPLDPNGSNIWTRSVRSTATTHRIYPTVTLRHLWQECKAMAIHRLVSHFHQSPLEVVRQSYLTTIEGHLANCTAWLALANTVLSTAAITGSGDMSNLLRCLALMSDTRCSWRRTPKPPSTAGAWK